MSSIRIWVVYVAMSTGHEYHNTIAFAEWFGPYTEKQAERLADKLNAILDNGETEHLEASVMPLTSLSPSAVVALANAGNIGGES